MRFVLIICGIYCFLEAVAHFLDLLSFYESADDFIRIYGIGPDANHWQFKSEFNYKLWRSILIGLFLTLSISSFALLRTTVRKRSFLIKITILLSVMGLLWEAWTYYIWYQSGYDHYPGYDPFLF